MLDARQPPLPLFDPEPSEAPRPRAARRRAPAAPPPDICAEAELRATRQAFFGLAARWGLTGPEALTLLGEPLASEEERRERLQALVGLNRSLMLLVPEPDRCRAFLREPLVAFEGTPALQVMLSGGRPAIPRLQVHSAARVTQTATPH